MVTIRIFQIQIAVKSKALRAVVPLLMSFIFTDSMQSLAADFPQAEISNGQITAKMYLPDAQKGFYRSTRFDWSGAVYSLQYKGHEFYGFWFDRIDPKIINWVHQGPEIVSGPCSAQCGPVDEFETPLGWDEAKPGGTFIKIGVGVLRRGEGNYNRYAPYEVLDPGVWSVEKKDDSVEFKQELTEPKSGYAYVYHKVVRLTKHKPEMVIAHSLKNTGRLAIESTVYNHNFVVIDEQPPGPDYTFKLPFQIQNGRSLKKELADVSGNEIIYMKPLTGEDEAVVFIQGFGDTAKDSEIIIENKQVGAGMRITGDRPLIREFLWSIRRVLAVEPYIAIDIEPGDTFAWENRIEYYTTHE